MRLDTPSNTHGTQLVVEAASRTTWRTELRRLKAVPAHATLEPTRNFALASCCQVTRPCSKASACACKMNSQRRLPYAADQGCCLIKASPLSWQPRKPHASHPKVFQMMEVMTRSTIEDLFVFLLDNGMIVPASGLQERSPPLPDGLCKLGCATCLRSLLMFCSFTKQHKNEAYFWPVQFHEKVALLHLPALDTVPTSLLRSISSCWCQGLRPIVSASCPRCEGVTSIRKKGDDPRTDQMKKGAGSELPGWQPKEKAASTAKGGYECSFSQPFRVSQKPWGGHHSCGRPAAYLSSGTVLQCSPVTGQWWTRQKGGDPKTDQVTQGADSELPGWQPKETAS